MYNVGIKGGIVMPEKEIKKVKTEDKEVKDQKAKKGDVKGSQFCYKFFTFDTMAIILSMLAIFCGMFIQVLGHISADIQSTVSAFVLVAYILTFSALICEVISLTRIKKFELRISLILILISFFVVCGA